MNIFLILAQYFTEFYIVTLNVKFLITEDALVSPKAFR